MGSIFTAQDNYRSLIGNEEFDLCIAIIVAGCVTTIISFFGCCGAIKENPCMLNTVSVDDTSSSSPTILFVTIQSLLCLMISKTFLLCSSQSY